MLSWPKPHCEIWRALLVQPRVVDFLREILDDGFRLDHLYGILMTAGTEGHCRTAAVTQPIPRTTTDSATNKYAVT